MTVYCHRCGGTGTITLAGHAYGCDGSCRNCPEPYPEPCPDCEMDRIISAAEAHHCETTASSRANVAAGLEEPWPCSICDALDRLGEM